MAGILFDAYESFIASGDSRVRSWPLMERPAPIVTILAIYLWFIKSIGPAWMKNRKSFHLRTPMFFYNALLVFIHIYFLQEAVPLILRILQRGVCTPQGENNDDILRIAELGWWYLFTKILELGDTVFFVLRKKFNQLSKLHIVHHTSVPIVVWMVLRAEPGGYYYFFPLMNSVVHTVMYTYYGLAALGPAVQKYLWWKKYLTTFQIVQFILTVVYHLHLGTSHCKASNGINFAIMCIVVFFLILFINFFRHAYLRSPAKKEID